MFSILITLLLFLEMKISIILLQPQPVTQSVSMQQIILLSDLLATQSAVVHRLTDPQVLGHLLQGVGLGAQKVRVVFLKVSPSGSHTVQGATRGTEGAFVFALSVPRHELALRVRLICTLVSRQVDVIFHAGFVTGADHVVVNFAVVALDVFAAYLALVQNLFGNQICGDGFHFLIFVLGLQVVHYSRTGRARVLAIRTGVSARVKDAFRDQNGFAVGQFFGDNFCRVIVPFTLIGRTVEKVGSFVGCVIGEIGVVFGIC